MPTALCGSESVSHQQQLYRNSRFSAPRNNAYLPQAGRIGDSPIIGAGTYARNGACAVSGTGQGEMFIRKAAAHDITARIVYGGQSLQVAADSVLREMTQLGVGAGFAAVDAHGTPYAPYNTIGMCGCSFFYFSMNAMLSTRLGCCCVTIFL